MTSSYFNPYIIGAPVPPDKFYGRQQMLQQILASIKSGNHVAVYGERRIGKTSLLHRLEKLLREEVEIAFAPLFIQMQMISEEKFFGVLIDAVLKSIPTSVSESLSPTIRQTSPLPYEVLNLLSDLEMVVKTWHTQTGKPLQLILLLDEGDRLNEFSETTQMQLRGLLQDSFINQHVRLVWSGVGIDRTWRSNTSPWFNLFKAEFHLGGLKPEEARRLILEPVAGVYNYDEQAIAKIQEVSLNKPYHIQRLCSSCIDHIQEEGRTRGSITLQDVEEVWGKSQKVDEATQLFTSAATQAQIAESQAKYETSEDNLP